MFKDKKKTIIIALAELLIFSAGFNYYQYKTIDKNTKAINMKVSQLKNLHKLPNKFEDFKLKDIRGKEFDTKKIKNKSIVMIFFSSTCPDCKSVMPQILKTYAKIDKSKTEFVFISPTTRSKELEVYLENNKLDVKPLIDTEGIVSTKYNVSYVPTMVVYNKKKELQSYHLGSDTINFENVVTKSIK